MAVLRQRTGGPACGRGDEPGRVGQAQRARPWAYLKDVLTRLPTHPNSRIDELLPHRWVQQ
ncbi:MAG: transposase domain-containing protein [Methylibium sp.]|nr:transposase domain-containing protein [Methylibium sp.]